MKLGINKSKNEHKIRGKEYMTFMIITDATKHPKTVRIPKWIRFPLLALCVLLVLGSLSVFKYVEGLEAKMVNHMLTTQEACIERDSISREIAQLNEELEKTKEERYQELVELQTLADELGLKLEELEAYRDAMAEFKEEIDANLSNSEDEWEDGGAFIDGEEIVSQVEQADAGLQVAVPMRLMVEPDTLEYALTTSGQSKVLVDSQFFDDQESASTVDFDHEFSELNTFFSQAMGEVVEGEEAFAETSEALEETLPYVEAYPSILPLEDTRVTSSFGFRRNPFGGYSSEFHKGIDLQAYYQPVMATGAGVVVEAKYLSGYGYTVVVDHGYGLMTKYAHNQKLYVRVGDPVVRGDVISKSGNSGRSTGPHLHYEILMNGEVQNPLDYIYEEK